MKDLGKINSLQLYNLWKNFTVGLVTLIATTAISRMLPYYLSPVVSLVAAAILYLYIYNSKSEGETSSCMIVPYAVLVGLMGYSFVTIILNVVETWGIMHVPAEFIFFSDPFIPSLILTPVCFLVMLNYVIRHKNFHKCSICKECKLHSGNASTNSVLVRLLSHETYFQLKNLTIMFGILAVIIWSYYLIFYVNINLNARDSYIFIWLMIIFFVLDEMYFISRYFNLYLDLKENDEIISPEELHDMSAKTYLRYYVICGNNMFLDCHALDPGAPYKEIIDTPFFTKRTVNGIAVDEVKRIIERMTGYPGGELRFFYGRKNIDHKNSILRYFYFLDGDVSQYQDMNVDGEWIDFEKVKYLYSNNPGKLSPIAVIDTTRLATIILTEKIFDDNGFRKSKIKMYNPSFNLVDVKKSDLDFQDDKWIEISLFNSDTPMYRLKRWWRGFISGSKRKGQWR
ncbi:MAG: hypothetical protein HDR88_00620 [Bacteroides sp.]|nr:hypothetical protein [Bacteroides sp.]